MEKSEHGTVQSVKRSLEIVEVLAESKESLGVTQISKMTGLSKTTAFRLLSTLIEAGYVQKRYGESSYQLSMKFLKISSSILEQQDIRSIAGPYIKDLSDRCKEIVHLAVMDVNEVVYIEKMESSQHVMRIFSNVGTRSPVHCTGLGKVFLSGLTDGEVEKIIAQKGLRRYTENTITNIDDLKKELALIRESGYAFDRMEHEIGVWCVAAPIFDRCGGIVAAISITAPEIYMSDSKIIELTHLVVSAAKDISHRLGYI